MNTAHQLSRRLVIALVSTWMVISLYAAASVPKFWSGGCIFTLGLGYAFYYAWSRIIHGTGQAGIVIIEPASPAHSKLCADLGMLFVAVISLMVLLGHDDLISWARS